MKKINSTAILEEVARLYSARDAKRKDAAGDIEKSTAALEQLRREREAAVGRGDIDGIISIDDQIRRHEARCEVARHYLANTPSEDAEVVSSMMQRLSDALQGVDADGQAAFIAVREAARKAYMEFVAARAPIVNAYAMLAEMAPADLRTQCSVVPAVLAQVLDNVGTVYYAPIDGPNPVVCHQWKKNGTT